jgi:hypothetical protein
MTAVPLFDALAHPPVATPAGTDPKLLARFAEQLVSAALADLDRLRTYEREFVSAPRNDPVQELEVRRSVWRLYSDWADVAEDVLARAKPLVSVRVSGSAVDDLDLAIGKVRARLTVSPEQTTQAILNAKQGRTRPAKELRDELRSRLRS